MPGVQWSFLTTGGSSTGWPLICLLLKVIRKLYGLRDHILNMRKTLKAELAPQLRSESNTKRFPKGFIHPLTVTYWWPVNCLNRECQFCNPGQWITSCVEDIVLLQIRLEYWELILQQFPPCRVAGACTSWKNSGQVLRKRELKQSESILRSNSVYSLDLHWIKNNILLQTGCIRPHSSMDRTKVS